MHAQNVGQVIKDCEGEMKQKDNVIADLQLQLATLSQQLSAMHQVYCLGSRGLGFGVQATQSQHLYAMRQV